jgi:plastocyanin
LSTFLSAKEILMGTRRIRLVLPAVAAVIVAIVLAGCGGSSYGSSPYGGGSKTTAPASPAAGGTAVTIENFAFTPSTLAVKAGTTVTWTNKDGAPHTVTATDGMSTDANTTGLFDSGSLGQGQTFSFTFTKAGTYFYECTIHRTMQSMHAQVVVSG